MKYAVTGGAGNISKPLALELLRAGQEVVVIGRDQDRLKELVDAGAKAAIGALEDIEFLKKAFAGADAAYCMYPPNLTTPDLNRFYEIIGKNYASAIRDAGVRYIVNLSSIGAHLPKGTGPVSAAYRAEQALNTLKHVHIKHLRPTYFYHNLLANIAMVRNIGIIGSSFSVKEKRFPLTDYGDIAAAAAEELLTLNFNGHSVRYIASDETDTEEIASVLGKAIGKPDLKWVKFSDEQALKGMMENGFSKEIAEDYIEMGDAINSGKFTEDYWKHRPAKLGNVKLEDFASVFASAYAQN